MHPVLFIVLFIAVVAIVGILISRQTKKRDTRKAQQSVDKNVEWQINEGHFNEMTIQVLATHSDKEKMARIVSARIYEYIKQAIHPKKLSKTFQKLGLFTTVRNNWGNTEIELAALIQQYLLHSLDAHDLRVYHSAVCDDKICGFEELNELFVPKVKDDMFTMNLQLN
jgi:hypothetical protein